MSVIAVKIYIDRILIAADSATIWTSTKTDGSHLAYKKLVKFPNGVILGSVGDSTETSLFQEFFRINQFLPKSLGDIIQLLKDFSKWKTYGGDILQNSHILVCRGQAFLLDNFFVTEIKDRWAIGAGEDIARSVLDMGYDPRLAVNQACKFNINCSLPIVEFQQERIYET